MAKNEKIDNYIKEGYIIELLEKTATDATRYHFARGWIEPYEHAGMVIKRFMAIMKMQDTMLRFMDRIALGLNACVFKLKNEQVLLDPDSCTEETLKDTTSITTLGTGNEIFNEDKWKKEIIPYDFWLLKCPECGGYTAADPAFNNSLQECYECNCDFYIPKTMRLDWFVEHFKRATRLIAWYAAEKESFNIMRQLVDLLGSADIINAVKELKKKNRKVRMNAANAYRRSKHLREQIITQNAEIETLKAKIKMLEESNRNGLVCEPHATWTGWLYKITNDPRFTLDSLKQHITRHLNEKRGETWFYSTVNLFALLLRATDHRADVFQDDIDYSRCNTQFERYLKERE